MHLAEEHFLVVIWLCANVAYLIRTAVKKKKKNCLFVCFYNWWLLEIYRSEWFMVHFCHLLWQTFSCLHATHSQSYFSLCTDVTQTGERCLYAVFRKICPENINQIICLSKCICSYIYLKKNGVTLNTTIALLYSLINIFCILIVNINCYF